MSVVVVLVSGPVGAGKTTVSREVAVRTGLPLVAKDDFKELLAEHVPVSTLDESRTLGAAAFELLYHVVEQNLRAGVSQVVEALWDPDFAPRRLGSLRDRYKFRTVEIRCHARPEILLERVRTRWADGSRHRVHLDSARVEHMSLAEFTDAVRRRDGSAPDLGGTLLTVDTSSFEDVDYEALARHIHAARNR